MSVRRKQLELMRRKMEWDTPRISTQQPQLELMRRKMKMDAEELRHLGLVPSDPREY
jgi:hypothetical protein